MPSSPMFPQAAKLAINIRNSFFSVTLINGKHVKMFCGRVQHYMKLTGVENLPHDLMVKAISLRNSSRKIYITLCNCTEPKSALYIANLVGESRAYVNMRLLQLVDQNLVKEVKVENHREKMYSAVQ
jgi:hypothetical protein